MISTGSVETSNRSLQSSPALKLNPEIYKTDEKPIDRVHPTFCKLPLIPQPLLLRTVSDLRASYVLRTASNGPTSQNGRRGAGFKVPLPLWERDLG